MMLAVRAHAVLCLTCLLGTSLLAGCFIQLRLLKDVRHHVIFKVYLVFILLSLFLFAKNYSENPKKRLHVKKQSFQAKEKGMSACWMDGRGHDLSVL